MKEQPGQPLCPRATVEVDVRRIVAACVGFLADSYDLFCIDLVVLILELRYGLSAESKALLVSSMLLGVVTGQLFFGALADYLGRKWIFVTTAALTVLGSLASASATTAFDSLLLQLTLCRFLLGLGVGGEYPLSAAVSAEAAADAQSRGQTMALVVSMQGFGMLLASLLAMLASCCFSLEVLWRVLLAFGAVPSAIACGLRWHLDESEVFERSKACFKSSHISEMLSSSWHVLLGTSSTWLLMNTFLYGLGSFKSSIFEKQSTAVDEVFHQAVLAAFTSGFAILGFLVGFQLITSISRFQLQFFGFLALTVAFLGVGVLSSISTSATSQLLSLGMVFFLQNCGPNLTTYVISAEAFPTCVRATCHGISAASGKLGAFLGALCFPLLEQRGMATVYGAYAAVAALGALVTYALTPRQAELEQLEDKGV